VLQLSQRLQQQRHQHQLFIQSTHYVPNSAQNICLIFITKIMLVHSINELKEGGNEEKKEKIKLYYKIYNEILFSISTLSSILKSPSPKTMTLTTLTGSLVIYLHILK
jgi:hypothetical protein